MASFLDSTLRPPGGSIDRVDDESLAALGLQRERALRSFDETNLDCRDDRSCNPVEQAIAHSSELLVLGRGDEALAMLEARLVDEPESPSLHEAHARALARLGRYTDAARAFEAEHAIFAAAKATADADVLELIQALEQRALRRRDRALALAEEHRP